MAVRSELSLRLVDPSPSYASFRSQTGSGIDGNPSIDVFLEVVDAWDGTAPARVIFDSGEGWRLLGDDGGKTMIMHPPGFDAPLWRAEFGGGVDRPVRVKCSRRMLRSDIDGDSLVNPLAYPLDMILLMDILAARGDGCILHASGIKTEKGGIVFPAKSGGGKSTIVAEMLKQGGVEVLSDDRIVVRSVGGRMLAYGTPWSGKAGLQSNERAELKCLCFPSRATANTTMRRLSASESLDRLLPAVSMPLYERKGVEAVLGMCGAIADACSAFDLGFVPGTGVGATVMELIAKA